MITICRDSTSHSFEKKNLVTQFDGIGQYDLYTCTRCGLTGKSRDLVNITFRGSNRDRALNCPKAMKPTRIKITRCKAFGKVFGNLQPGSIHAVVAPPPGAGGVWVMGVGEPVKVLPDEYETVEEEEK